MNSLPRGPKLNIDAVIATAESALTEEEVALARAEECNAFALALHAVLGKRGENLFHSPLRGY